MIWRSRREGSHDEALLAALGERLRSAAARIKLRPDFQSSLRGSLTMEAVLGERLRDAATTVTPRPDFQSSLRTSLIMEASTALVPAPGEAHAQPVRMVRVVPRRRMTIAAAFVATALGLGGMTSASASALPGEGLYPIKRVAEQVELAFHRSLADRGAFKLELAERRLNEARALAARGAEFDELAIESVREFEETAADGTADLMAAYRENNARASMVVLNEFTVRTDEVLDALAAQLPSESTVLDDARESVEAIGSRSEALCPSCGGGPEEGWAAPIDSEPVPEPEPETPAEPPAEPSLPAPPPVSVPSENTPSVSEDEDEDEDEESDDADSDEPDVPTPTPTPTPEPTPTPSPTPTPCPTTTPTPEPEPEPTPPCPTPEPTEPPEPPVPPEPPEPPVPTDPPTILPKIVPETLKGVGQGVGKLVGGTLGGLHLGQNRD